MAVLSQKIKLVDSKGEKIVEALFDSVATYSFVKEEIAEKIEQVVRLPEPRVFSTAKEDVSLKIEKRISVDFYINGYRLSDEFFVSSQITEDVIIGVSTLQKWRLKLDFENEKIIVDPKVTRLIII